MTYLTPSGGDDTPAIQDAIDTTGVAELSHGAFNVSTLNLTDLDGAAIIGRGYKTSLVPSHPVSAVIDGTGTTNLLLRDFRIGFYNHTVVPSVGVLLSQLPGNARSDTFKMEGVRIDGSFSLASLFALGVQSSIISGSQIYNYQGITAIITGNNFFGAQSDFSPMTANEFAASDWTLVGSELHNMNNGWALWLGGVDSLRILGGNLSSQHVMASINNATIAGASVRSSNIIFDGCSFYSDNGINPGYAVGGDTGVASFRANYLPAGVALTGP